MSAVAWDWRKYGSEGDPIHKSDLLAYGRCPRRFRFSKDAKAGTALGLEKKVFGRAVAGTASHETLRRALPYSLEKKAVELSDVRSVYWSELRKAANREDCELRDLHWPNGVNEELIHKTSVASLFHFLTLAPTFIKKLLFIEAPFVASFSFRSHVYHTAGTLDLVYQDNDDLHIVADHKTGTRRPPDFVMLFGYELGIYGHAYESGSIDGQKVERWPDRIAILMIQDFLPAQKPSSRRVWNKNQAAFFKVRRGGTANIQKGQQRGPGFYNSERVKSDLPRLFSAISDMVSSVRLGRFFPVLNDECSQCSYKVPCIAESFAKGDLTTNEKRRLDAALRDLPPAAVEETNFEI